MLNAKPRPLLSKSSTSLLKSASFWFRPSVFPELPKTKAKAFHILILNLSSGYINSLNDNSQFSSNGEYIEIRLDYMECVHLVPGGLLFRQELPVSGSPHQQVKCIYIWRCWCLCCPTLALDSQVVHPHLAQVCYCQGRFHSKPLLWRRSTATLPDMKTWI